MAPFTYASYVELLKAFKNQGYQDVNFLEFDPKKQHLALRHDVDVSLERALEMARLEASLEVKSTYFFLLRTEFYNLGSLSALQILKEILHLGHQIGLHFDVELYPHLQLERLSRAIDSECETLEHYCGAPVHSVSFHRPVRELLGADVELKNRVHTYAPRFFLEATYLSDSLERWPGGYPADHEAFKQKRAIQLLIHPIWWDSEFRTPVQKLNLFLEERKLFLDKELERNLQPYRFESKTWDYGRIQKVRSLSER